LFVEITAANICERIFRKNNIIFKMQPSCYWPAKLMQLLLI